MTRVGVAEWPAPAKLNLMLHVIGRRDDGYHLLQTVFQIIDFCDALVFEPTEGVIERERPLAGVAADDDLCLRAARLLKQRSGYHGGARIRLQKRIPMGAGLGGGSSDAATTLVALNEIWKIGYDRGRLAQLGVELGADVPVFVHGHSAWGEGVGERLVPLDLPARWYLVLVPDCAIATRSVFQAPELTRNTPPTTIRGFLATGGRNDCEPVVRERYPQVAAALDWLGRFAPARLTGTGAAVFAAFANRDEAETLAAACPTETRAFVARGLNESPLNLLRA